MNPKPTLLNRIPTSSLVNQIIPKFGEERIGKFTTVVFTLVASAAFGLFAINPTLSTIAQLKRQLSDEQAVSQQLDTKLAAIFTLQKAYPALQANLTYAMTAVPDSPDTLGLAGVLQGLAIRDNVTLSHLQIFPVEISQTQSDKPLSYVFSVNLDGSYTNLVLCLSDLTQLNRLVTIDTLSFAQDSKGAFRVTIKGKAYAQKKV